MPPMSVCIYRITATRWSAALTAAAGVVGWRAVLCGYRLPKLEKGAVHYYKSAVHYYTFCSAVHYYTFC